MGVGEGGATKARFATTAAAVRIAGPALLVAGPVAATRGEHLAFVAASALALGCFQFVAPSWGWMAVAKH